MKNLILLSACKINEEKCVLAFKFEREVLVCQRSKRQLSSLPPWMDRPHLLTSGFGLGALALFNPDLLGALDEFLESNSDLKPIDSATSFLCLPSSRLIRSRHFTEGQGQSITRAIVNLFRKCQIRIRFIRQYKSQKEAKSALSDLSASPSANGLPSVDLFGSASSVSSSAAASAPAISADDKRELEVVADSLIQEVVCEVAKQVAEYVGFFSDLSRECEDQLSVNPVGVSAFTFDYKAPSSDQVSQERVTNLEESDDRLEMLAELGLFGSICRRASEAALPGSLAKKPRLGPADSE